MEKAMWAFVWLMVVSLLDTDAIPQKPQMFSPFIS
jgi:hypothetical protein